jgi:hypothetical protein
MTEGMPNLSGTECFACRSTQIDSFDVVETANANSCRVTVRLCERCLAIWCGLDEGRNPDLCSTGVYAVLRALRAVQEMNQGLPFRVNKM